MELNNVNKKKEKLHYLEGLRGIMAMNVILCHFICVYYPIMYFQNYSQENNSYLNIFTNTPLSVLVNGNVAVVFFFVLTGFLVGMSCFQKDISIKKIGNKVVNRYLRLLCVIFFATIFTFSLMKLGLMFHLQIDDSNVNLSFLEEYCNFSPTIVNLIVNIFYKPFISGSDFIGPFWTIKYEFFGYIFIFIISVLLKKIKWRRVFYIIVVLLFMFYDFNYAPFVLGLIVADLQFNNTPTLFNKYYDAILDKKWFILSCFIIGIYFACIPLYNSRFYPIISRYTFVSTFVRGAGIALIILVLNHSKKLIKILELKPLVFLGKISFETYALHWPVMLSLGSSLFILIRSKSSYNVATLLSFIITVIVIYIASILLNILVNQTNKLLFKNR